MATLSVPYPQDIMALVQEIGRLSNDLQSKTQQLQARWLEYSYRGILPGGLSGYTALTGVPNAPNFSLGPVVPAMLDGGVTNGETNAPSGVPRTTNPGVGHLANGHVSPDLPSNLISASGASVGPAVTSTPTALPSSDASVTHAKPQVAGQNMNTAPLASLEVATVSTDRFEDTSATTESGEFMVTGVPGNSGLSRAKSANRKRKTVKTKTRAPKPPRGRGLGPTLALGDVAMEPGLGPATMPPSLYPAVVHAQPGEQLHPPADHQGLRPPPVGCRALPKLPPKVLSTRRALGSFVVDSHCPISFLHDFRRNSVELKATILRRLSTLILSDRWHGNIVAILEAVFHPRIFLLIDWRGQGSNYTKSHASARNIKMNPGFCDFIIGIINELYPEIVKQIPKGSFDRAFTAVISGRRREAMDQFSKLHGLWGLYELLGGCLDEDWDQLCAQLEATLHHVRTNFPDALL